MEAKKETIEKILKDSKTVAMVGASDNPDRASNHVFLYLEGCGYHVIPVNPTAKMVCGKKCYPDLSSIPERVDVVDIFRRSEDVPAVVDEALKIGAKAIWMQEGVVNEQAAKKAEDKGLPVVMNRCMLKEHSKMHA
ncbi:MAG: CoA-binding protein [Dehalococcoidales bacterium]|nr:CoA-binding protein [Dehalococcoidales bacterium]